MIFLFFLFCFVLFCLWFFWLPCKACGILVPRPGIEPGPSAVKAPSPNHWTAREFPIFLIFKDPSEKRVQPFLPNVSSCHFLAQICLFTLFQGSLLPSSHGFVSLKPQAGGSSFM